MFLSLPQFFFQTTSRQRPRTVRSSGHTLFLLNLSYCDMKGLKSHQYRSFCELSILFYYRLLNHGSSTYLWQRATPVVVSWLVRNAHEKKNIYIIIIIIIISGRSTNSRQNCRVILQSIGNLQARPRAAGRMGWTLVF